MLPRGCRTICTIYHMTLGWLELYSLHTTSERYFVPTKTGSTADHLHDLFDLYVVYDLYYI